MKLKVPPVVIATVCVGMMWLVNRYTEMDFPGLPKHQWIVGMLLGLGGVLGILGLYQFYRNRTSVDPHQPDKAASLVTGGVYRISRNPMYVGLLLMLIAYGVALQNIFTLLCPPLFVWYMNRYQIKPEEEILLQKFGDEYRKYRSEIRRWL